MSLWVGCQLDCVLSVLCSYVNVKRNIIRVPSLRLGICVRVQIMLLTDVKVM